MRFIAITVLVFGLVHTQDVPDLAYYQPEQVHLAFGEKANDIVVTWSTLKDTKETLLLFGEDAPIKQVTGKSDVFVDGGELKLKQWIHRVHLKDLKFNTTYFYKVGSRYGWSKKFSFTTSESEEHLAVKALIFGDLGAINATSLPFMLEDVEKNRYDVIIHVGDLAYNMSEHNGTRGNTYMNMVEPMVAKIPYMIAPGNHEVAYNYSHVKKRFSMPGPFESMYHSFDLGLVHFVAINTEAYYNNSAWPAAITSDVGQLMTHYNWLKQDLEKANRPENRQKHPWIVVFGHRPFYCSNNIPENHCPNNTYPHRLGIEKYGGLGLEKLLVESSVDLVLFGHEHSYERFWPVYDSKVYNGSYEHPYVNPGSIVQITSGSAGCEEGNYGFENPASWSAFQSSEFGYARMYCPNRTHLYFEQIEVRNHTAPPFDNNKRMKTMDTIWLVKDNERYDAKF